MVTFDFQKPWIKHGVDTKRILVEGTLYFANHIVNRIPHHRIRLFFHRRFLKFEIGEKSFIFLETWFDARNGFKMGQNSVINQKCCIDTRGGVSIGANVSISAEVCILTTDHNLQCPNFEGRERSVVIEDYVFVGTRAIIMPGVTLGQGCAIAAGSVVVRSVAPFTIVAGVPTKPIGTRTADLNYTLHYDRLFA
ncbi:acyltransferase [Myxacorys almedinensis]|uniref:Acyltransferase n=1 Tax=Myxacorys almedinensis A TaxID=2690445 RepID=A0A8J8CK28_9CYAN|nr:acyltransferase [Myxacorys almedinensis]NDJ16220.1 acyltransferase [Myxacorys almedinensis A]